MFYAYWLFSFPLYAVNVYSKIHSTYLLCIAQIFRQNHFIWDPIVPCAIVQSLSHVWLFATPWTATLQASLSFTISQSLLKLLSIESVMPSNHLMLCHPLLLLPSVFPRTMVYSNELALHIRWPKYWSFSFSTSPSSKYSGLISFRIDWFDLLAIQGTLKSLLQHHSLKTSILWCSAFLMVQLYIHTWLLEKPLLWLYRPLKRMLV